jgi:hypothetical protein
MPTETIPFEILGHFEEIIDIETGKCYGTRPVAYQTDFFVLGVMPDGGIDRLPDPPPYGFAGRVERLFRKGDKIWLDKAHKGMQPYKFKTDAKCWLITHPVCGRMKPC